MRQPAIASLESYSQPTTSPPSNGKSGHSRRWQKSLRQLCSSRRDPNRPPPSPPSTFLSVLVCKWSVSPCAAPSRTPCCIRSDNFKLSAIAASGTQASPSVQRLSRLSSLSAAILAHVRATIPVAVACRRPSQRFGSIQSDPSSCGTKTPACSNTVYTCRISCTNQQPGVFVPI